MLYNHMESRLFSSFINTQVCCYCYGPLTNQNKKIVSLSTVKEQSGGTWGLYELFSHPHWNCRHRLLILKLWMLQPLFNAICRGMCFSRIEMGLENRFKMKTNPNWMEPLYNCLQSHKLPYAPGCNERQWYHLLWLKRQRSNHGGEEIEAKPAGMQNHDIMLWNFSGFSSNGGNPSKMLKHLSMQFSNKYYKTHVWHLMLLVFWFKELPFYLMTFSQTHQQL